MKCSEVGFGTGDCAYNIMLPYYIRFIGNQPIKPEVKYVTIDKCLVYEIISLWERGIKTTGCCCGHGESNRAFIGVKSEYIDNMKKLGYVVYHNDLRPSDEDSFMPKTLIEYNDIEIDKGFSWWIESEMNKKEG